MIEIKEHEEDSTYQVKVIGEVDASSSLHLDAAIEKGIASEKNIVVDLTELNYISSAGLGVFISYLTEAQAKNIKIILFGLSEKVKQVFEILGLLELLIVKETKEEALMNLNE